MKRLLCLPALLLAFSAFAQVHCTWDFFYFTGASNGVRRVEITPTAWGLSGSRFITPDRIKYTNDASGSLTVSNMATNLLYRVEFFGPFQPFSITNYFPPGTTGAVRAEDYLTATNAVGAAAGYTIAQANSRFYLNSNPSNYVTATVTNGTLQATNPTAYRTLTIQPDAIGTGETPAYFNAGDFVQRFWQSGTGRKWHLSNTNPDSVYELAFNASSGNVAAESFTGNGASLTDIGTNSMSAEAFEAFIGGGVTYTNTTGTVGVISGAGIGTNTSHLVPATNGSAIIVSTTNTHTLKVVGGPTMAMTPSAFSLLDQSGNTRINIDTNGVNFLRTNDTSGVFIGNANDMTFVGGGTVSNATYYGDGSGLTNIGTNSMSAAAHAAYIGGGTTYTNTTGTVGVISGSGVGTNTLHLLTTNSPLNAAYLTGTVDSLNVVTGNFTTVVAPNLLTTNWPQQASNVTVSGFPRTLTNVFDRVNVKDFGAVGDGSADDTVAIQYAINVGWTNEMPIYFPNGDYKITTRPGQSYALKIPSTGEQSLSRLVRLVGDHFSAARIMAVEVTNGYAIMSEGHEPDEAHYKMTGLSLLGPYYAYPQGTKWSSLASIPYSSTGLFAGTNKTFNGGGLASFGLDIKECYIAGFYRNIHASIAQTINIESSWVVLGGQASLMFSHCDSVKMESCHIGTPVATNWNEDVYNVWVIGTTNSTWGGNNWKGNADAGVHKIFENIENAGPFLYADTARLTVLGGQFEYSDNAQGLLTNGMVKLVHPGQYSFIGSTINLPGTSVGSNNVIFKCLTNSAGTLYTFNCSLGFPDAELSNVRPTWFSVVQSAEHPYFFFPFWVGGAPSVWDAANGLNQWKRSFMNCQIVLTNGTTYLTNIPPMHLGDMEFLTPKEIGRTNTLPQEKNNSFATKYFGDGRGLTQPFNSQVHLRDDFAGTRSSNNDVGELGWRWSGSLYEHLAYDGNTPLDLQHPHILSTYTANAAGSVAKVVLNHSGREAYAIPMGIPSETQWIFCPRGNTGTALSSDTASGSAYVTNTDLFLGLSQDTGSSAITSTNHVGVRGVAYGLALTNGGQTNFMFKVAPSSGVQWYNTDIPAIATNWYNFRMITGTNTLFTLDMWSYSNGAPTIVKSYSTNSSTSGGGNRMHPIAAVVSYDTYRYLWLDYFQMIQTPQR